MDLFDKRFVYLEWDDVLQGKEVVVADTFPELRGRVNVGDDNFLCTVKKNDGNYPFIVGEGGVCYAFVYYDPNYECKVAYKQGKVIQFRYHGESDDGWAYCTGVPKWLDTCEYRVKPEAEHHAMPERTKRRMTNRELARWIAQGNGQAKDINVPVVTLRGLVYDEADDDKPCPSYLAIRGWDETEWHEPEVEE
jgi:hypothetical protein